MSLSFLFVSKKRVDFLRKYEFASWKNVVASKKSEFVLNKNDKFEKFYHLQPFCNILHW